MDIICPFCGSDNCVKSPDVGDFICDDCGEYFTEADLL
jgi:transcription initiation factor TFIIIB Brf1 subunit/transcription initiation factor TFIIB